jgi:soluble P-type ATPase
MAGKPLENVALGVAVLHAEGSAVDAVLAADIVVIDILSTLDLMRHPLRLTQLCAPDMNACHNI